MPMPMYDANVAAMARQQLNGEPLGQDDEARRKSEAQRAAAEAQAEADAVVASRVRANQAEDEDEAHRAKKRIMRRISAGWGPLESPMEPADLG